MTSHEGGDGTVTVGGLDGAADGLRLTWLGHACVVIDVAGHRIITDPLLGRHAGLLRRRGAAPDPSAWQGSDVVLVSHLHHDHAELASLRRLADRTVLAAGANARWLRGRGVAGAVTLAPEHPWTSPDGRVHIEATHAVHGERPMPHRPNAACGFTITCDDPAIPVVWFAGDTERFATMSAIRGAGQRPVDLAVVPVGGWGPRLSGGHMDPADAARAVEMVGARWAVPVHWGTLHPPAVASRPRGWMDRPGPAFVAAVGRLASGCTPVSLEVGEAATFTVT